MTVPRRGKRRAAEKGVWQRGVPTRRPSFSLFASCGGPSFRCERSERTESPAVTRNSDVLYYYPALRAPLLKQKGNFPAPAQWCRGGKYSTDESLATINYRTKTLILHFH